jgi:thiopurine S-methyltransferase
VDHDFWHQRWASDQIAFHEANANALLVASGDELLLSRGDRIFLPLCGMTLDIEWFLARGNHVVGAELSPLAIEQLFERLRVRPQVEGPADFARYSALNIDMFVGDFFRLSSNDIGNIRAVYDRAALVALPEAMRLKYAKHLVQITGAARQLLITFEYDQALVAGPPFSVIGEEVKQLYGDAYAIRELQRREVAGGLRGTVPAMEVAWLLSGA